MLVDVLTSHTAYEDFRTSLKEHPIGFRGQPAQFTENFLRYGFDRPRPARIIDFSQISWDHWTRRDNRIAWRRWFQDSIKWGATYQGSVANMLLPKFPTVESYLDFFQERPAEYCSMLVLKFAPGSIKGHSHQGTDIFVRYDGIIGAATLTANDFSIIRDTVAQRGDIRTKLRTADHLLTNGMIRACLEVVRQTTF